MNTDLAKLIPELQEWNDGGGIEVRAWLSCVGDYQHAIAYGSLFWPQFTEHDGCIFFQDFSTETYEGFMKQAEGDKKRVEAVMNHRHILDLFPNVQSEPTKEQIIHLGHLLRDMWQCKLNRDYPGRRITVSFLEDDCGDLLDYQVTFFQEQDERAG